VLRMINNKCKTVALCRSMSQISFVLMSNMALYPDDLIDADSWGTALEYSVSIFKPNKID